MLWLFAQGLRNCCRVTLRRIACSIGNWAMAKLKSHELQVAAFEWLIVALLCVSSPIMLWRKGGVRSLLPT